jgi:hypothetical protein
MAWLAPSAISLPRQLGLPGWCCSAAVPVLAFTTTARQQQVMGTVYLSWAQKRQRLRS